jgi:type II secretory pathway component PulF
VIVAVGIMILLMTFVVPKFKDVFAAWVSPCRASPSLLLRTSEIIKGNILAVLGGAVVA